MLVRLPQTLYVTEHFQLGRFGQVTLSSGARLSQPTNIAAPGAAALAVQAANDRNRIILDDAQNSQNPDPIVFGRGGAPLSAANTLRGGDSAAGIVGVLTYTWAGNAASGNAWRVRPIGALGGGVPAFQPANPRPAAAPDVGGTLRVASVNLLNYFNTFGASACANGVGGAATECRGANSQAEFDRQWPKSVAVIVGSGADIIGVNELENDGYGSASALQDLVGRLNSATAPGTYAFIDADARTGQTNALGTDVGTTAALNSGAFGLFTVMGGSPIQRNRPALAQAFQDVGGERFTVVVTHLKSKGSSCADNLSPVGPDPDAGDGQGNCNLTRTRAAQELAAWLAADPTASGDPDVLIVGDLNAYAKEDPVSALVAAGYIDMVARRSGPGGYSYAFDGQWGALDHALASATLRRQIPGAAEWHVNADEPGALDYNTDFKTPGQIASLYAADRYRASDHDPLVVGLGLGLTLDGIFLPLIGR
jgi:predicted extracellular nuclease